MVTLEQIRYKLGRSYRYPYPKLFVHDNWYHGKDDEYGKWELSLVYGRSYLVGSDVPMDKFIRSHRSPLNAWQKLAYQWALENPTKKLVIDTGPKEWDICVRGEYVEFGLPHYDKGGEMYYISNNGKSKILVNAD